MRDPISVPAISEEQVPPRNRGQFRPGQTGNPSGRPRELVELRELARQHTREAIERLVEVMRTGGARDAVAASQALLDRAWGKPSQAIEAVGVGAVIQVITGVPRGPNDPIE